MKKIIKIFMLVVILIIACITTVKAADATVTMKKGGTYVVRGGTLSVTVNVACEEGINGFIANLSYDEEKIELEKTEIVDGAKWVNLGEGSNLEIIHNSTETATSADIVKLTFKVKDNVEDWEKIKVTLSNIVVDSDAGSNSRKELGTKETESEVLADGVGGPDIDIDGDDFGGEGEEPSQEKTLTSIEITAEPTKKTYKVGEKFNKAGMKVVAKYSDETSSEITNYKIENGDKIEAKQTSVKISYTEGEITKTVEQQITVEKDSTESGNILPHTGILNIIGIIAIVAVLGAMCLIIYSKYRKI